MSEGTIRIAGALATAAYGAFVVWLYVQQPQTVAEVAGGLAASVGTYEIDQAAMDEGLRLFRSEQFEAARFAFDRADRARRDARTQFYIAYSFYRQGWGRLYHDDALYKQGLEAVDRAIALSPQRVITVEDANLEMHTSDELKAEIDAGLRKDASDLNPMRVFTRRK
jgi:tetratricopeptide (TPR) repeat protein